MDSILRTHLSSGFTLIELLVTLAIIAVLASMVMPVAQIARQRGQEQELRLALREIRQSIDAYHRATEDGRISISLGGNGYPKDLDVLVDGVENQRDPRRNKLYFLRRVPRDPMNPDTSIPASDSWGKRSYASDANDPKEGDDVYDVYSRSTQTGLNGIAYSTW